MKINTDILFKTAKDTYEDYKKFYEEATFVARSNTAICFSCGRQSTKSYTLALRCLNTKHCQWSSSSGKYEGKHRFYHSNNKHDVSRCKYCNKTKKQTQQAEYKHIAWVCSKPCETMFMLKLI